jgi:hypothetical protein
MLMGEVEPETASSMVREDPSTRQLLKGLRDATAKQEFVADIGPLQAERPFVTPRLWAAFSAYFCVHSAAYLQLNFLADVAGTANIKPLNFKSINNMLKLALPQFSDPIDQFGERIYPQLLEQLESNFLDATAAVLDGKDDDAATVARMAEISRLAGNAAAERSRINLPESLIPDKNVPPKA